MSRTKLTVPYDGQSQETIQKIAEKILKKQKFTKKILNGEELWIYGNEKTDVISCVSCIYGQTELFLSGFYCDFSLEAELDLTYSYLYRRPMEKARFAIEEIDYRIHWYTFWEQIKVRYNIPWHKRLKHHIRTTLNSR